MFYTVLCLSLAWFASYASGGDSDDGSIESDLIKTLTDDANLDLPVDQEYEDLRAELLAYHTGLASLVDSLDNHTAKNGARRNVLSKSCWEQGGICIRYDLCEDSFYKHQVPGCKDKKNVCCFNWSSYKVRDHRGLAGPGYPWGKHQAPYQGQGVVFVTQKSILKKKKNKKWIPQKKISGNVGADDIKFLELSGTKQSTEDSYCSGLGSNFYDAYIRFNHKDTFGKPVFGSPVTTCWARKGICIRSKYCVGSDFDSTVPGCATQDKVCCRVHRELPPTVGPTRSTRPSTSFDLDDLEDELFEDVALKNDHLLRTYQQQHDY